MSDVDFAFAWEGASEAAGPFRHLQVVAFRGSEGISSLYRYEVTLLAREPAPEVDPEELIQARATLRITTLAEPAYRVVHGIITEAEELGATQSGMLYRVVLSPPLVRAAHRTRCRIFLEKTTREILDAVLQGDPSLTRDDGAAAEPDGGDMTSFTPAREHYAFRVAQSGRIDDVATRPYCVQYNESDLAFVARLLEEEGISYHFEHGEGVCLLVLADADGGRARLDPFAPLGPGLSSREIASVKLGARLRPRKVSLLDYNWKKPALDMAVATSDDASGEDLVDHEYPGRYPDAPDQGKPLAQAKLDRLAVEARYAVGEGAARLLSAGSIFKLEHPTPRYEGEYLVTRMEVRGEQQGVMPPGEGGVPAQGVPFAVRFECARRGKNGAAAESRFRPARTSPKPRVHGTQTAFVTAEPSAAGAEIHVGGPPGAEIGCVRVKFHWDQDARRLAKEPSSCWVRVNQVFAGVGEGAVFHPRVGVEVIVDFEEGDPDRPIVVGRVYNGQNRPPGGSPTVSTFKTMTSPGGGSFNELTFDDTAGSQQIKMHTPMNWNSEVGNDRNEQVSSNSGSTVGSNRSESTGADRSTLVGGSNAEMIGGNESTTVGSNQRLQVGGNQAVAVTGNRDLTVTGNQGHTVTGNRNAGITGNDQLTVTGNRSVAVTGAQTTDYQATHEENVGASQKIVVGAEQTINVTGPQGLKSATSQKIEAPSQEIKADGAQALKSTNLTVDASADVTVTTPTFLVNGATIQLKGDQILIKGGQVTIEDGEIAIKGGKVTVNGSPIEMDGGGLVQVTAGLIKLN